MKAYNLKKIWQHELESKLKKEYLDGGEIDYRVRNFLRDICDDDLYTTFYPKVVPRLRFTFPLFILTIILFWIYSAIKWLFTGSFVLDNKSYLIKKVIQWDKYCGFKIVCG